MARRQVLGNRIRREAEDLRDGVDGDLVAFAVRLLDGRVICVLVRDEECGLDVAAVGVLALSVEDLLVQLDVVIVDGVVESDRDHHGHVFGGQVSGNRGSVLRAEAIGQDAHGRVAGWGTVRVVIDI